MPLVSRPFGDIITFTRASTGTFIDASGVLRTAAVNAPRLDFDPVTRAPRGFLIEEQRTNLVLNSATLATQNVTVTAVQHTLSFTGTGTVALSGTFTGSLVGTGANNRVSLTFTPTAGTLTLTVTGSVTLAQLETGPFATSYIPTTGAQATRAADLASVNTLSPWYNPSEGSMLVEFVRAGINAAGSQQGVASLAGSSGNSISLGSGFSDPAQQRLRMENSSVEQVNIVQSGNTAGTRYRMAGAWAANNVAFAQNGALVGTDTTATVPTVTSLLLGRLGGVNQLNGHLRRFQYFPRRLSDAEIQALTAI